MTEELKTWLNTVLLEYGEFTLDWRMLISFILSLLFLYVAYRTINKSIINKLIRYKSLEEKHHKFLKNNINWMFLALVLLAVLYNFRLNVDILPFTEYKFLLTTVILGVLLYQLAYLLDYIFSNIILSSISDKEAMPSDETEEKSDSSKPSYTIRYAFYLIATLYLIQYFGLDFVLFQIPTGEESYTRVFMSNIFLVFLFIILAQLLAWIITKLFMHSYYKRKNVNVGTQYAVNQLIKYFIYVITLMVVIESIGIEMTVIWGGAAALLVGIGLGLQQTFNDLMSGVILLFERSVEVGDVVEIDDRFGVVQKIGVRTSLVKTRDNIIVIVPNSKLIVNNMINWSHFDDKARFTVTVGVAYGSETSKVKDLLVDVAHNNPYVLEYPTPHVFFSDFSDSALTFNLLFWTRNFMMVEAIKSDLRYEIDTIFRKNDVKIPFPQRDVWFKNVLEEKRNNDEKDSESDSDSESESVQKNGENRDDSSDASETQ